MLGPDLSNVQAVRDDMIRFVFWMHPASSTVMPKSVECVIDGSDFDVAVRGTTGGKERRAMRENERTRVVLETLHSAKEPREEIPEHANVK